MELTIYPVFDRDLELADLGPQGPFLAAALEQIDDFADDADLPGLSDWADSREVPEDFDGSAEDLDELLGPSSDWFEAAKGARSLEQLAAKIDAEGTFAGATEVVAELRELARTLQRAAAAGARFRLEIG
jgi:hypothetical protein